MSYRYSLKFSLGTIMLMVVLMLMILSGATRQNTAVDWVIYSVFSTVFILLITMLVIKRLVPALRKDIALSFDDEGLSDYIRDVSIGWKDIASIQLIRGRSAGSLEVKLKWESDYGNSLVIPLRWVEGKDEDIYNEAITYLEINSGENGM